MSIWALLFGIPFIIGGIKGHNRRHNARTAPTEAAERIIKRDEQITDAEREAIRRDQQKSRVRFQETAEDAPDVSNVDPYTGEVR